MLIFEVIEPCWQAKKFWLCRQCVHVKKKNPTGTKFIGRCLLSSVAKLVFRYAWKPDKYFEKVLDVLLIRDMVVDGLTVDLAVKPYISHKSLL